MIVRLTVISQNVKWVGGSFFGLVGLCLQSFPAIRHWAHHMATERRFTNLGEVWTKSLGRSSKDIETQN